MLMRLKLFRLLFLGFLGHSFEYRQIFLPSVCTGHPFLKAPAVGLILISLTKACF
jgi:hypothetical protein